MIVCALAVASLAAAEDGGCAAAQDTHLQSFDSFTLTYFDGRGLAEVSRTLLATAGRFPGQGFTDVRLSGEEFAALRDSGTGDLAANLNRTPVLNHNGLVIGESKAIARYLSKQLGLFGANDADAAKIDAICEHIVDIQAAYRKVVPYKNEFTQEEQATADAVWFETPPSPELDGRKNRQLQWFLAAVENLLPGDGYTVGGRPSLADAYFFNMLGEHAAEVTPARKGEPFGSLAGVAAVLAEHPKLKAVVETFRSSPGMTHYLASRVPVTW